LKISIMEKDKWMSSNFRRDRIDAKIDSMYTSNTTILRNSY